MEKLTPTELAILSRLADGGSYAETRLSMGVTANCLHQHCKNIRRKTGINTQHAAACRNALHRVKTHLNSPTATQRAVLEALATGSTYEQIAAAQRMTRATALNHACQGCKRLGITSHGAQRLYDIRAALGLVVDPMDDPMF